MRSATKKPNRCLEFPSGGLTLGKARYIITYRSPSLRTMGRFVCFKSGESQICCLRLGWTGRKGIEDAKDEML